VNPEPGSKAPVGWPTHDSLTDILLPSPGSPRYRFPCFDGTMKMCDSLRPSHRASLPSLGDTRRCVCRFAPSGPERQTAGQGFVIRSPLPDEDAWRRSGPPKVPGEPACVYALFSDPGGPAYQANYSTQTRPPRIVLRRLSREVISGLNRTASTLAVYASSSGSPAQDARLASGCWPALPGGIGYPQGSYERFQITHPPFPGFPGANDVPVPSQPDPLQGKRFL